VEQVEQLGLEAEELPVGGEILSLVGLVVQPGSACAPSGMSAAEGDGVAALGSV
jgi:hypothetical protein